MSVGFALFLLAFAVGILIAALAGGVAAMLCLADRGSPAQALVRAGVAFGATLALVIGALTMLTAALP